MDFALKSLDRCHEQKSSYHFFPHFLRNDNIFFPWYFVFSAFFKKCRRNFLMMHQDAFVFNFCFDLSVVKVRFQKIQTNVQWKVVFHILLSSSLCLCENQQHVTNSFILSSRNLDWEERVRNKTVLRRVRSSAPY